MGDNVSTEELDRRVQRQDGVIADFGERISSMEQRMYNGLSERMRNVEDKLSHIETSMVTKTDLYRIMAIGGSVLVGLITVLNFL